MVVDRDLNVVYANEAAWPSASRQVPSAGGYKCYQAFLGRDKPCGSCPVTNVSERCETQAWSHLDGADTPSCGICEASPLMSMQGEAALVLAVFSGHPSHRHVNAGVSGSGIPPPVATLVSGT